MIIIKYCSKHKKHAEINEISDWNKSGSIVGTQGNNFTQLTKWEWSQAKKK